MFQHPSLQPPFNLPSTLIQPLFNLPSTFLQPNLSSTSLQCPFKPLSTPFQCPINSLELPFNLPSTFLQPLSKLPSTSLQPSLIKSCWLQGYRCNLKKHQVMWSWLIIEKVLFSMLEIVLRCLRYKQSTTNTFSTAALSLGWAPRKRKLLTDNTTSVSLFVSIFV